MKPLNVSARSQIAEPNTEPTTLHIRTKTLYTLMAVLPLNRYRMFISPNMYQPTIVVKAKNISEIAKNIDPGSPKAALNAYCVMATDFAPDM